MDFSEGNSPSKEAYLENILAKMEDLEFVGDTVGLIRKEEQWDPAVAFDLLKERIIEKL